MDAGAVAEDAVYEGDGYEAVDFVGAQAALEQGGRHVFRRPAAGAGAPVAFFNQDADFPSQPGAGEGFFLTFAQCDQLRDPRLDFRGGGGARQGGGAGAGAGAEREDMQVAEGQVAYQCAGVGEGAAVFAGKADDDVGAESAGAQRGQGPFDKGAIVGGPVRGRRRFATANAGSDRVCATVA